MYDDPSYTSNSHLFPFSLYDLPWANSNHVDSLNEKATLLYKESSALLKGIQWILTPTESDILSFSGSLKEMSSPLTQSLPSFLTGLGEGAPVASIFVDFYDTTDIVKVCVERSGGSIAPPASSTLPISATTTSPVQTSTAPEPTGTHHTSNSAELSICFVTILLCSVVVFIV